MNLITVIPISRGIGKNTLTYFTKEDIALGSLVSIPLRSKKVHGLVVGTKSVAESKIEIKNLSYNMKKIDKIKSKAFLTENFIESVGSIADYFAGSTGAVLSALLPQTILESAEKMNFPTPSVGKIEIKNIINGTHETLLIQASDEERYAEYKSIIREEFARGRSIFFCLPTTEDIKNAKRTLEKGIEKYTFALENNLQKKELLNSWQNILDEKHSVLIIGTPKFISLPRTDIGLIIVDKESSRGYKTVSRPFIDARVALEIIAKHSGARIIFGDIFLRLETLWKEKNGKYVALSPLKFKLLSPVTTKIIDMKGPADMKKKEFKIISDQLKKMIEKSILNSERIFIFCGRKGLYPETICADCGTEVVCKNCKSPVVLYKKKVGNKTENYFACNHCGERREADKFCVHCKGWRLMSFGVGVERVKEEIENLFPKLSKIFVIDSEHVKNHNQAVKTRDEFYESPGSVMIGTEMALSYLNQKIENTAVANIDSFFSIPDFRINEKVFHILLELKCLAEKEMLIQTRQTENQIFGYVTSGNLVDFYRDEINDRKNVDYPPFTMFVKLTLEGSRLAIKKNMDEIVEFMKPYEMQVFESYLQKGTGGIINGIISLPEDKWVDVVLLDKLRNLPQYVAVKVDPDSLL